MICHTCYPKITFLINMNTNTDVDLNPDIKAKTSISANTVTFNAPSTARGGTLRNSFCSLCQQLYRKALVSPLDR